MKRNVLAAALVFCLLGSVSGCSLFGTSEDETTPPTAQSDEEQQTQAVEDPDATPDDASQTDESENQEQDGAGDVEEEVQQTVPAMYEIVKMKDSEITRLMAGLSREKVRAIWTGSYIDWDNSGTGTVDGISDVGDEWVYNDPKHEFGANVRVYYNPEDGYQTVSEVLVVSNNGETTAYDGIPNSGDGWTRGGVVRYWEDDFELTAETVRDLNCLEFQERLQYMTRRSVLNLLGEPVGYMEDDPHTEVWELSLPSDTNVSPADEAGTEVNPEGIPADGELTDAALPTAATSETTQGVSEETPVVTEATAADGEETPAEAETTVEETLVTVLITFDEEFGTLPEVCHVLPVGAQVDYESYNKTNDLSEGITRVS